MAELRPGRIRRHSLDALRSPRCERCGRLMEVAQYAVIFASWDQPQATWKLCEGCYVAAYAKLMAVTPAPRRKALAGE